MALICKSTALFFMCSVVFSNFAEYYELNKHLERLCLVEGKRNTRIYKTIQSIHEAVLESAKYFKETAALNCLVHAIPMV